MSQYNHQPGMSVDSQKGNVPKKTCRGSLLSKIKLIVHSDYSKVKGYKLVIPTDTEMLRTQSLMTCYLWTVSN